MGTHTTDSGAGFLSTQAERVIANWKSADLHDGQQRIQPIEVGALRRHGHAHHRQRRGGGDHARQVRGATSTRNDHLQQRGTRGEAS